jgi:ABC-type Fe3+ transport system substrate-binding protein
MKHNNDHSTRRADSKVGRRTVLRGAQGLGLLGVAGGVAGFPFILGDSSARADEPAPDLALVKAAQKDGTLTYYHTSGIEETNGWTSEFSKKYQIQVKNVRGGSYIMFDRWINEERAGRHICDVFQGSDPGLVETASKEGFVANYVPAGGEAIPGNLKKEGSWYSVLLDYMGIVYNYKRVSEDEITDLRRLGWGGLADPRWKGRYTTATPAAGGSTYGYWFMVMKTYKDKYGEAFAKKLAANNPAIYESKLPALDRLAAGEYAVSDMGITGNVSPLYFKGAPVRLIFPDPALAVPNLQCISTKAPHPNAARLFQEWMTSVEGQLALFKYQSSWSSRTDVVDPAKAAKKGWFGEDWFADPKTVYIDYLYDPEFNNPDKPLIAEWNKIFGYSQ